MIRVSVDNNGWNGFVNQDRGQDRPHGHPKGDIFRFDESQEFRHELHRNDELIHQRMRNKWGNIDSD